MVLSASISAVRMHLRGLLQELALNATWTCLAQVSLDILFVKDGHIPWDAVFESSHRVGPGKGVAK